MVTVDELESLTRSIADKRREIEVLRLEQSKKNSELETLEKRMMVLLEEVGKHDYHSEVGTVYITERASVKVPKDLEAKRALFDYLRQRGIFEEMVSVNSQTLNAYYKAEKAAAEEKGDFAFQLPGVGEPTVDQIVAFRKAK